MHIAIAGPIATADIAALLEVDIESLPVGYVGAPILGTLITELLRRGHRVSAFTLTGDLPLRRDAAVTARGGGFEMHYMPMRPRAWPFNGWRPGRIVDLCAFERAGLERAITAARPDVVHAHWAYEFGWAALRTGVPHVVTCHDSPFVIARFQRDLRHGGFRWLRAGMAWHVLRKARHVTTVSPYMVEQIQPLCRARVALVPNPLDARAGATPRSQPFELKRILFVSNGLDERRNVKTAMVAFSLWAAGRDDVELHLYGQGFEPDGEAQAWWRDHGLKGTALFHGPLQHEQLLQAMAECDVLLHSALEESFGMVLAEAMASGLVAIGGRHSGAVPWVIGEHGVLVGDVSDPSDIAAALSALERDPELRQALGRRGRESVLRRFGAGDVTDAYLEQYAAARRVLPRPVTAVPPGTE